MQKKTAWLKDDDKKAAAIEKMKISANQKENIERSAERMKLYWENMSAEVIIAEVRL